MGLRRLLDTNVVLYHLGGRLVEPLGPAEYFVSVITELELLSYPGIDTESEGRIRAFLLDVTILPLDSAVCERTISLRRVHHLKLPDAVIAATAQAAGAELITNDATLLKLPGVLSASASVLS